MDITLTSAMRSNLFSLQQTSKAMDLTQSRLSTGKKVQTALDDPIKFFAAQNHQQRAGDLAFRKDDMSEAIQTIKAANNGIEGILDLIAAAKATAQSARSLSEDTADASAVAERLALSAQFTELRTQIDELAEDSGYKGINFLGADTLTVYFDEEGVSSLDLVGFNATTAGALAIAGPASNWAANTNIDAAIGGLDTARNLLRSEAKTLSSNLSVVTIRQDFTEKMINTLEDGAVNLTIADMNEEGANMLMLQTRQALGTTSLSLASQAAQSVLRLF
ncbi:MAG: flagellin [Deltaproteobacteria bacterium]|nr:flagellin [Deltaproteobacteria bacterium]